jgi:hypothetical protein
MMSSGTAVSTTAATTATLGHVFPRVAARRSHQPRPQPGQHAKPQPQARISGLHALRLCGLGGGGHGRRNGSRDVLTPVCGSV